MYGMTTRSIHQYKLGIYKAFGLNETEVTKFQTGGPDGDLGSNEIKISSDQTIGSLPSPYFVSLGLLFNLVVGVVDGSGVIYDPTGLDRAELLRLAGRRQMIAEFDLSKLGPDGFRVLITDRNIYLPSMLVSLLPSP